MTSGLHFGIAGAGAWGTALGCAALRAGSPVTIWAHEAATADAINTRHENTDFLPGVVLDPSIDAVTDMSGLGHCDVLLLVTPSAHLETVCRTLRPHVPPAASVCVCTKGIDSGTGRLMTEVATEALGRPDVAGLSGPSFAREVAAGLPTAVTVAGLPDTVDRIARSLAGPAFRIYRSDDLTGIGIGGAVKNVIAIACGIAMGRRLGFNARAAVISRGLSEMTRLGEALGARRETLMGLSGLGDLVLTCTGDLSRNLTFGRALGEGQPVADLMANRRDVVEGAATAPAVVDLAGRLGIDMPISTAVNDVLRGQAAPDEAIARLLARPAGEEFGSIQPS